MSKCRGKIYKLLFLLIDMFKRIKAVGNRRYNYLEKSYRIGKKVKKISFYIGVQGIKDFSEVNKKQIDQLTDMTLDYIYKNLKISHYFEKEIVKKIENYKTQFRLLWDLLDKNSQQEIMDEFFTRFLVNNMVMEGATITYSSAERINSVLKKGKGHELIRLSDVSDEDVRLYIQLNKAYKLLNKKPIRTAKNIADMHNVIYKDIYSFAGKFREVDVTFGDPFIELADTLQWVQIRKGYNKALSDFKSSRGKKYDFERIIDFHISYQKVHGFRDGNSRLGRLIMTNQLLKYSYPPIIIRSSHSLRYRKSLVKSVNHKYTRDFVKLIYQEYKRTFERFWLPRIEKKLKLKKI